MFKIGQNWGKIANYPPQCSAKIGTPVRMPLVKTVTASPHAKFYSLSTVFNGIVGTILEKHAPLVEKYIKTSKTLW